MDGISQEAQELRADSKKITDLTVPISRPEATAVTEIRTIPVSETKILPEQETDLIHQWELQHQDRVVSKQILTAMAWEMHHRELRTEVWEQYLKDLQAAQWVRDQKLKEWDQRKAAAVIEAQTVEVSEAADPEAEEIPTAEAEAQAVL